MAVYRKPVSVSLPPPLVAKIERLAKRQNQSRSELVRAALNQYVLDADAKETLWKRVRAYGAKRAKEMGIRSEEDLQAILYEMRHGRPLSPRPNARTASRR